MGNSSPPSYTESAPSERHVLENYEVELQQGVVTCRGNGLEPFNINPKPYSVYLLFEGKTIYGLTKLGRSSWFERSQSNRVLKSFKKLLLLKVKPGNYDVEISIRSRNNNVHVIRCKMDKFSYEKLSRILQDIYNDSYYHYRNLPEVILYWDRIDCTATIA